MAPDFGGAAEFHLERQQHPSWSAVLPTEARKQQTALSVTTAESVRGAVTLF